MHKIDGAGATGSNTFTKGDPLANPAVAATVITDDWLNAVQAEIIAVLTAAGASPIKADNGQLAAAIAALIAAATTAATLLTAIKTVDGAGSGMDADLLDGQSGSYYQDAGNLNAGTILAARFGASSIDSTKMAANKKFSSSHGGAVSGNVTLPTIEVGEEGTAWYSQTTTSTSYKAPATGTFDWVLFDSVASTQAGLAAAGGATLATFTAAKTVCIKYYRTA